MKYLLLGKICILFCLLQLSLAVSHPEAKLEFEQYCAYFKYPVQKHQITT